MKVFISQPMSGLSNDEIIKAREEATKELKDKFNCEIEVIDNLQLDVDNHGNRLFYISNDIRWLGEADMVYLLRNWNTHRGCRVEHYIAKEYGIDILCQ